MELYLATNDGLSVARGEGNDWRITRQGLDGREVTSVIAREGVILAGTTNGIFRSEDGGETWQETSNGLRRRHVRWLAYQPDISDFELAGTEPAAIFISRNGGDSWSECNEVSALRDRFGWWLPYSPQAGCVRGFAFHGQRAYAAVEVGGLLRSDDGGETWRLADGSDGRPKFGRPQPGFVHPDVHSVAVHPSSADLVYAPTGGGFYRSEDGGRTWVAPYEDCYARAVWVDPADPAHLVLGPAEDPGGTDGRIEESHDGGQNWQVISERWSSNMVERFVSIGSSLFAVMANGQLLGTPLEQWQWRQILPELGHIHAVTTMA